jgi:hypothetical protein
MRRIAIVGALVALVAGIAACAPIRPWQRETLARPELRSPPWPEHRRAEVHVYEIREGSSGAYGSSGGGCGCN